MVETCMHQKIGRNISLALWRKYPYNDGDRDMANGHGEMTTH
jgi:hypothetical protein